MEAPVFQEQGVDEYDYGYRVASPLKRRLTYSAALQIDDAPMSTMKTNNPVDEYSFIMSSPDPVSDQQCEEGMVTHASNERVLRDGIPLSISNMETQEVNAGDEWKETHGVTEDAIVSDLEMSLE